MNLMHSKFVKRNGLYRPSMMDLLTTPVLGIMPSFYGWHNKPMDIILPEDLTTYTELDPSNRMSETETRVTLTNADRDENFALYYDFTNSYFNQVNIDFTIQLASGSATSEQVGFAVSNTPKTANNYSANECSVLFSVSSGTPTMFLVRGDLVAYDTSTALSAGTPYYCTLARASNSDNFVLYIYSDADRSTLVDTLIQGGFGLGSTYRYLIPMTQYNAGSGGYTSNGYVEYVYNNTPSTMVHQQISAGSQDVSSDDTTFVDDGSLNRFGDAGTSHDSAWLFSPAIPAGKTIRAATLTLVAGATDVAGGCNVTVHCEDADDPSMPTSESDFNGRTLTTGTSWSPSGWTVDVAYLTCDFSGELQDVIDRAGWASGQNVIVYIKEAGTSTSRRQAKSYEGASGSAAILNVSYY